jgi:hypothetical protein
MLIEVLNIALLVGMDGCGQYRGGDAQQTNLRGNQSMNRLSTPIRKPHD